MDDKTYGYDGGGTRKSVMRNPDNLLLSSTTSRPEAAQKLQDIEVLNPNISNSTVFFEEDGPSNEIGGAIRLITIPRLDMLMRQSPSSQCCSGLL